MNKSLHTALLLLSCTLLGICIYIAIKALNYQDQKVEQTLKIKISTFIDYMFSTTSQNNSDSKTGKIQNQIDSKTAIRLEEKTAETNTELYYKHLDSLLLAQNPTNVELQNVEIISWVGDNEPFYNLVFKNITPLNANNFSVIVNDGKINFEHTKSSTIFYEKNLSISSNQVFKYPLVSETELAKYFKVKKEKILGIGLTLNEESEFFDKIKVNSPNGYVANIITKTFWVTYKYKTIFGQEVTKSQLLCVYINNNWYDW